MDALWITVLTLVVAAVALAAGWIARGRLGSDDTALLTRLAASETACAGLREQLERQSSLLRETGEQARAEREALRERERREAAVLTALSPVQETLAQMQRSVSSLERDRQAQFGALAEQLRRAQETDESLRSATESLTGALRSTTVRGTWGETQLRRIVEAAGLTRHVDFDLQHTITTDDGVTGRPDMVVRLPGDKALAVDAKAPMDAFLHAASRANEDQAPGFAAHAKAVRTHVDALAKRAYWTGLSASPEFVICFLPSESMLSAALDTDPSLLDYAFAKRVALASPVNLWAVLKTVAFTWTQEDVSAQAHQLFSLGNQLYERLGTLTGHAADLRSSLERAVGAYNRFAGSLESRVLVTARKFPGIDATKLDRVKVLEPVTVAPATLTAPELLGFEEPETRADLGVLRARIEDGKEHNSPA